MTIPPNWLQASKQIGKTPSSRASWLLQLSYESPVFEQLGRIRQESLEWQLQAFLDEGKWSANSGLWVDEEFTEWWYSKVWNIFSKLRQKESACCATRLVQNHTAGIEESTGTMRVHTEGPAQRPTKEDAIYRVYCTLDGILRRCARCKQLFIRTRRQRYCKKQCSNRARLERFRKKRTPDT
jgi:hypothetical protein